MSWNKSNTGCPCHGCGVREVGCHGRCAKYRTWSEKMAEIRKARYDANESFYTMPTSKLRRYWKDMKYKRIKGVGRD